MKTDPQPKGFQVDSYHPNVEIGDSAVHVLVAIMSDGREEAEKIVWIDSGAAKMYTLALKPSFENIAARYPNLKGKQLTFHVVVITH